MVYDGVQSRLTPNHRKSLPNNILVLDTETSQETQGRETRHTFRMAWTYAARLDTNLRTSREDWRFWRDAKALCTYLETKVTDKKALYVFGHNVFFDLQVSRFFEYFADWKWQLDFLYDKGLTYILIVHKGKRRIKIVSSTNYYDFSLAKLGEMVGRKKLEVTFGQTDYDTMVKYNRQDVAITVDAIMQYLHFNFDHDTGRFALTKAAQSFAAFRHRFMRRPIWLHDCDEATQLERAGYFGGRCEAFRFGEIPGRGFTFLDVNSMYPFVMRNNVYPSRLIAHYDDPLDSDILPNIGKTCIMAEVDLSTNEPAYCKKHDGRLIFPVGEFTTVVCTEGLSYAIKHKHLRRIRRATVYRSDPLFGPYVDYFYPLKAHYGETGNLVYRELVKKYLNSLYGKFGQKYVDEISRPELTGPGCYRIDTFDIETGSHYTETKLLNTVIRTGETTESKHSFPAIAAHVTEYSRFVLWRAIKTVGYHNTLYCDTDSIVTTNNHARRIAAARDDNSLGALSVDKTCDRLTIHGLKDYETDGIRKTKGVPKTAIEVAPNVYQYDQFLGQSSHLRLGELQSFITIRAERRAEPQYAKGRVLPDGRILPFRFPPGW